MGVDSDVVSASQVLQQGVAYTLLKDIGIAEISGDDAIKFLQNQTTNDVQSLTDGEGCLNAAVDRQGKIQAVFSLHRHGERYWLILEKAAIEGLVEHLKKFVIMDQVHIGNRSKECRLLAVQGAQAKQLLAEGNPELSKGLGKYGMIQCRLFDCPVMILQRSLTSESGYIIVTEEYTLPRLLDGMYECDVDLEEIDEKALEPLRIEAGLPRFGIDYTTETLLPETGLEVESVNYDKGCYLGQEVIARVKTYGSPQKKLVGLTFNESVSSPAELPADLLLGGEKIGSLTSFTRSETLGKSIGLAYLDKSHRTPDKTLAVTLNGKEASVTVTLLPFVQSTSSQSNSGSTVQDNLLQTALTHFSQGQDEEAINTLRQLLSQDPDNIEALEALGAILYRVHQQSGEQDLSPVDEAISLMEKILTIDPDHLMAHTNLSIYWLAKGDKDKAEEEKAKATITKMRQHAKKAGLDFSKLEEERKKAEEAKKAQLEERIQLFIDALKHNPDDPLGNFGLGSSYLELMRFEDAIAPLQKTIENQPKHTVAYLSLGKALAATGKQDEARTIFDKGIEVASERGDLMPLNEMKQRRDKLS